MNFYTNYHIASDAVTYGYYNCLKFTETPKSLEKVMKADKKSEDSMKKKVWALGRIVKSCVYRTSI